MNTSVLAHWESRSRKHWLTLLRSPHGYRYESPGATGAISAESDEAAIAMMERRLSEFLPDKAKTAMRRVDLQKEARPKCSVCRKPAGTNHTDHGMAANTLRPARRVLPRSLGRSLHRRTSVDSVTPARVVGDS